MFDGVFDGKNLMLAAKATRESPFPEDFSMKCYAKCGTPCCILGNYAASDVQDFIELDGDRDGLLYTADGRPAYYDDPEMLDHFQITEWEAKSLFSTYAEFADCNEAADAVESFVNRKLKELENA